MHVSLLDFQPQDIHRARLEFGGIGSREFLAQDILGVCLEEMTHLALVANLTTAVGGGPHFFRSAFPVRSGFFPSDFVLELAPFDQDTLQHFIFLERPEDEPVEDAEDFKPENEYTQGHPPGRLMAHSGDYTTVGQLYEAIEDGVVSLSNALGEQNLFCGSRSLQISSEDVQLKGLAIVQDKASALEALRMIVQQGEGARTKEIPTLINSAKSPKSMTPFVAGIRISNPAVVPLEIRSCGNRQIRRAKSGSLSLRR